MSIEDHVLALVEEGNPVPDPDAISVGLFDPAAYLATLQRRSSEVAQIDVGEAPEQTRADWWWMAAAAAIIAILGAVVFMVTRGEPETTSPATERPPSTTTELLGVWSKDSYVLTLDDREFDLSSRGEPFDHGTLEQTGDRLTLTSADDSVTCGGGQAVSFAYTVSDDSLHLTSAGDDCSRRALVLGTAVSLQPGLPDSGQSAWESLPILNARLGSRVRLPNFIPNLAFDSPGPLFRGGEPTVDDFVTLFADPEALSPAVVFMRLASTSIDEQVERFSDQSEFEDQQVKIGGADGVRISFTPERTSTLANTTVVAFPARAGVEHLVYYLEVQSHIVVIAATLDGIGRETFDDLVESVVWRDLSN